MIKSDTRGKNFKAPVCIHAPHPMIRAIQSHVRPPTIITCFPGYTGGIKVQVVRRGLVASQCCSFLGQELWTEFLQLNVFVDTFFSLSE